MFGYVTINKMELKMKDYYLYRSYYCGLCHKLKEKHGRVGQMTLTYDMTFLVILLTALYEEKGEQEVSRCLVHPVKKQQVRFNDITEYAADMNIALTYHHFLDDWEDDHSYKGRLGSEVLKRKYQRINQQYPRQCQAIQEALEELAEMEKQQEERIDYVSGCFGKLMGELFLYREDEWQESLKKMGFYLGKFIYLIDAYEDLPEDIKRNRYNPLKTWYGKETYEEDCKELLSMMMAQCTKEYEKLPIVVMSDLLRNILYVGVWTKFDQLQMERVRESKEFLQVAK